LRLPCATPGQSSYYAPQRRIQKGFKVSTETPFEIDFNPGSFNTLIEQSGRDSLNNAITMQ